ncbi:MAG: HepT-like ribonuclease domain-containing protein [Minisyncoccota bacterium]
MEKSDNPYLAQIVRNIEKIRKYVGDEDFASFVADEKTQSAVLMQLQLIGELAKRVSSQAQIEMPAIPWRDVADFRNVVAHDYYEVQLPIVWTIVTEQLAPLEMACTEYIKIHPLA